MEFDIHEIIKRFNLEIGPLAKVLYPTAKFPKQAFDRILKGEAYLDTKQIEDMAAYIGVPTTDLFTQSGWKGASEGGVIVLTKGPYKVKLGYGGVFMHVFRDNILIGKGVIDPAGMTLSDFTKYIDNYIKQLEDGSN